MITIPLRSLPRPLILAALALLAPCVVAQSPKLTILILNAKTNQPIPDERLNVAFRADQIGSVALGTDKRGVILLDPGNATTLRILSNMYADCRPRAELYTDYSLATLRSSGIATGNLCSTAHPAAKPGQLLLFEIPKTRIPTFPAPPNTTLPHSDEHQP